MGVNAKIGGTGEFAGAPNFGAIAGILVKPTGDSNPRPAVYESACRVWRAVSPPVSRCRFPRYNATSSRPSVSLPAASYRRLSSEWG
jgi:hypothetical protein